MNSKYILRIDTNKENYKVINSLFNVSPTSMEPYWELSINEDSNLYGRAISYFLELIEKNVQKIFENGLTSEDLSIWYLYEYDEQCNIEFEPNELKRLGEIGITLCISCWKKDDTLEFKE